MRYFWAVLFLLGANTTLIGSAQATTSVHYGLFGDVHVAGASDSPKQLAILLSDSSGWDDRAESLANALGDRGTLVLGIDLPAYWEEMNSIKRNKCSLPSVHIQEMSDWMQRHFGLTEHRYPVLIGDGAGASFAYAVNGQGPRGEFTALVTLGWDFSLRLPKNLCHGDAGAVSSADHDGIYQLVPIPQLPNPWLPLPYAQGAKQDGALQMMRELRQSLPLHFFPSEPESAEQLTAAINTIAAPTESALPAEMADLPLVVVPAEGRPVQHVAIILTGDGGWQGLDIAVANQLAKRGIPVVALSTLRFFWNTHTPADAAAAVARIISHYAGDYPDSDFVVIGYSFGASLAPVVINLLTDTTREHIAAQVLISPDEDASFEIHVGGSDSVKSDNAIPIAPEIDQTKVPVICVHGEREGDDSFCAQLRGKPKVSDLALPGGHNYDGDYDALGAGIAQSLPSRHALPLMNFLTRMFNR